MFGKVVYKTMCRNWLQDDCFFYRKILNVPFIFFNVCGYSVSYKVNFLLFFFLGICIFCSCVQIYRQKIDFSMILFFRSVLYHCRDRFSLLIFFVLPFFSWLILIEIY